MVGGVAKEDEGEKEGGKNEQNCNKKTSDRSPVESGG
jgi:hypothetical protein